MPELRGVLQHPELHARYATDTLHPKLNHKYLMVQELVNYNNYAMYLSVCKLC